ncbi:MAG: MarR family transcriptional regulator [Chitinophagales bacterium]
MASIEVEIKQKRFRSEHDKALVNVLYTANWMYSANAAVLKQYGITPEQFNVLRILRGSHPNLMKLGDITSRMLDKNSNATRLVEKLRLKQLVHREICPTNRRQVDITITDAGLKLLEEIDSQWESKFQRGLALSASEAEQLNHLLDKMRG